MCNVHLNGCFWFEVGLDTLPIMIGDMVNEMTRKSQTRSNGRDFDIETELRITYEPHPFLVMVSFIVINWIKHRISEAHI